MASADSKYLKTLYVLIKDTLNSLSVSWKNLDEKSEATYKIWKDENGVRLYRIITNCLNTVMLHPAFTVPDFVICSDFFNRNQAVIG